MQKSIILPCVKRPDLDCVAGSLAYAFYLNATRQGQAYVWLSDKPDPEVDFYLEKFGDTLIWATEGQAKQADAFVLIDFSVKHILPEFIDPLKVIQVIDHHMFTKPEVDFPNAHIQLEKVGAAATQVTEYFIKDNLQLPEFLAAMLLGAIYSNTLCLKGDLTTERDLVAFNWLKNQVPDADNLLAQQLAAKGTAIANNLFTLLIEETKIQQSQFGQYGFSQLEIPNGQTFWVEHQLVIKTILDTQSHPMVFNLIDLSNNSSVIYTNHSDYADILAKHFTALAGGCVSEATPAWMRKQIIPLFL